MRKMKQLKWMHKNFWKLKKKNKVIKTHNKMKV